MNLEKQTSDSLRDLQRRLGIEVFPCADEWKEEWGKCKRDPVYFIKTYGMTYDPRLGEGQRWIKFALWSKQEDLIRFWQDRESEKEGGIVEKSRDTGVSWCVVGYTAWKTIFFLDENTGLGAALEEQVDHPESEKAIMWKLRGFLDHLPRWMLPKGYRSTFKMLVNPNTGSRVEGQAGLQIGRGGRTGRYFIDEFGFVADSSKITASVAGNTNCLFPLSTPNGVGNEFQRMVDSGIYKIFRFHWTDDPRKTPEWAEKKKAEIGPVTFAQEYDIDYASSLENICIPGEWVRAAINLKLTESGPFLAGLDVGAGKDPTTVVGLRRGPVFKGVRRRSGKVVETVLSDVFTELSSATGKNGEKCVALAFDASGETGRAASKSVSSKDLSFKCYAVMGQRNPTTTVWPDGKRSDQLFLNLRAELWWRLRERFRKTFERVSEGYQHPDEECISIPNDPQLVKQLSTPLYERTDSGKIQVESKAKMKARGVRSPDDADCMVYTFACEAPLPRRISVFEGYTGAAA